MASGRRWLPRTAAAVLLILAGIAAPAGPVSAADPDPRFTFDLTGTTIPLGVTKKRVHLRFTNQTDETPREIQFYVRSDELDWVEKVSLIWPDGGGAGECDGDYPGWYCRIESSLLPQLLPAPGGTVDLPIDIHIIEKREPYEGSFLVEAGMAWGDEAMRPTVTKRFTIKLVDDPAADLSVVAPDVTQSVRVGAGGRPEATGTLNPGELGALRYRIVNQGREAVTGVKVTVNAPTGVTFTQPPAECTVGDDGRSAVCTYDKLALVPVGQDADPDDAVHSAVELHNLVTVAASVEAPVTLRGGTVRVEGLTEGTDRSSGPARTVLPANAVAVPAADVDDSDNEDGFAVVVAASGSGGGGNDGGGDDGDGSGGGLPVTGPQAGLIAGTGLAIAVGGGVLLLLARRRRTILVIRDDDTTTV